MRMLAQITTFSSLLNPEFNYYKFAEFHDGSNWSLHGAWPERSARYWPQFCQGSPFNATALDALQPRLEKDWPNYWGSSAALHKHEYLRHGTCSGLTEVNYFNRSLNAYERYNLNDLDQTDLQRSFRDKYGASLNIDHRRHGRAKDVSFCLNKNWTLIECPP